ncbi:MAG: hypothetical protein LBU06_09835 [Desulfovibrio sp.]|jgi:NitT/TauT family transport system substrate-binding protein|nr:hypothetical protein [Desulfovibrio sp.]
MIRFIFRRLFCAVLMLALTGQAGAVEPDRPLLVYTAITATTPQIPLWAALAELGPEKVAVEYWKTPDDLRGVILAGRGDIWVGHLEGFAQAALRKAPVTLVAVTGWKKFRFIAPKDSPATDMASLALELREKGELLHAAPQGSPGLAVLEEIQKRGGPAFSTASAQPRQLILEMLRGTVRYALLPEPLVSVLLAKQPSLRVVAGLEEEFSRLYGGPGRLPLAGIAVNTRFAEENPEFVRRLARDMEVQAARLAGDFDAAARVLPQAVKENLGMDIILASLAGDLILAAPAAEVKEEIAAFLRMALSGDAAALAALPALMDGPFLFAANSHANGFEGGKARPLRRFTAAVDAARAFAAGYGLCPQPAPVSSLSAATRYGAGKP